MASWYRQTGREARSQAGFQLGKVARESVGVGINGLDEGLPSVSAPQAARDPLREASPLGVMRDHRRFEQVVYGAPQFGRCFRPRSPVGGHNCVQWRVQKDTST